MVVIAVGIEPRLPTYKPCLLTTTPPWLTLEHQFDAIIITKTWLKDNNDIWKSANYLNRNGYHLLCSDRPEMKQEVELD